MTEILNFYDYLSKVVSRLCHKTLILMTNKFNTASLSSPLNTFWGFIMKRTNLYQAIVSITALSTIMGAQAQNAGGLEEITVVGSKASLLSAVEKQRESDSIISVVDSDALGGFADTTAAEAIRRLSGISVENDQGEGEIMLKFCAFSLLESKRGYFNRYISGS